MENLKKCSSCQESKPKEKFYYNKNTKDKLGSQCRSCDSAGRVIKRRKRKQRLVDHFGGKCTICGYNKSISALQFHHPLENKEGEVSDLLKFSFEKALVEASKCILLCANCHAEEHSSDVSTLVYRVGK